MKRIGIFPAGSEIGLEICTALKYAKNIEIIGLSSIESHASYVYSENVIGLPNYNEINFLEELNSAIISNNIDMIFPAYDDIQLFLTVNQEKVNAKIITSSLETVQTCRYKSKTYEVFYEYEFVPKTFNEIHDIVDYPVFVKPDRGQGSQNAYKVKNIEELTHFVRQYDDLIICEYLPGNEYTVSCFTDNEGKLLSCSMRNRKRIRNGISVASESLEITKEVLNIAKVINQKLNFLGAWFFQIKENSKGEYKLLEVAPRIAGTMGLDRNRGINYPLLTVYTNMGIPVEVIQNNYKVHVDRALISRYKIDILYNYIYVDLDDTIIVRNRVNSYLMMFLYQCLTQGKKIILITKHVKNVNETLCEYKISKQIFDSIIHINKNDNKAQYIIEKDAIFIDDSYAERKNVSRCCKIPVFDVSEVESLIDWRM